MSTMKTEPTPATEKPRHRAVGPQAEREIKAPELAYQPQNPQRTRPRIALIGCGGITREHLKAYRAAGYDVAALCDLNLESARSRQAEFYPEADIYSNHREMLKRDDIEVVDITTHPPVRPPLIEDALLAGKHVLSQKPFVLDLKVGQQLVELADQCGRILAVNQNARWAPHFSYARAAVMAGLVGDVNGIQMAIHWDHRWVEGTPFEKIRHLILYDYAIHWFDFVNYVMQGSTPLRCYASTTYNQGQTLYPPLSAQVAIEYPHTQVSIGYNAGTPYGRQDSTYIAGSAGSIFSTGPNEKEQDLTLFTAEGIARPKLQGSWFPDGFHGAMGELLLAIEEGRQPTHSAENNLTSLALCFAAIHSAETHEVVTPGEILHLPTS